MDYQELEDVYEFHRNMRKTPWLQLFPHWWDENDALLNAIGNEVERIKAQAVFTLLNAGIKPPVLLWQESINHETFNAHFNAEQLPKTVTIQAPLYETWGKITLTNNTEKDIDGLILKLDNSHGYAINQLITQEDILVINLTENKVLLNKKQIEPQTIGEGMPYFVTQQNNEVYDVNTPLHNEVIRLEISTNDTENIECDIDIDIELENAVFTNEQNIEITGLEAVPIDRVELYVKYDFPFNSKYNGWQKAWEKEYEKNTNVVYDRITTQIYTKEFYVDVYFKTLQYPYTVGFPCYKEATLKSPYHVNSRLDKWGEQLGLPRRLYKTEIPTNEYYRTFPIFYPFDIEQDYWYYKRLTSEYSWVESPINDVDIKDTDGNNVIRLYSINPFTEDFAVHAKSRYPVDKEFINYNNYHPIAISQQTAKDIGVQTPYKDIINLLSDNNKKASITLNNYTDNNDVIYKRNKYYKKYDYITELGEGVYREGWKEPDSYKQDISYIKSSTHQSTELITYFDLSSLPQDVNIENIEFIVEAESTDNKKNKYATENTGVLIPNYNDSERFFIPLTADKNYQLKNQEITYSNDEVIDYLNNIKITDENIRQSFTIGEFQGKLTDFVKIPFELEENSENVDDITDVWVYYNGNIRQASYKNDENGKYIYAYVPNLPIINTLTIICKSQTHKPFSYTINVNKYNQYSEDGTTIEYQYIQGPIVNDEHNEISDYVEWHTDNLRNLIQKQGIYFRHILKNTDEQSSTTVFLYNIQAKITYSPKKSNFKITTNITKKSDFPKIGTLNIKVENTGEKNFSSNVDIITPSNIVLSQNNIPIDLKVGQSLEKDIDITATYPIDDGFYDIVTICEDSIKKDSIEIFSDGLIATGVNLKSHHGKYNDTINLKAEVYAIDGSKINGTDSQVQFYINGFAVGNKVQVVDGLVEASISPKDYYFTGTGNLTLEAKFLGTTKYASSSNKSTIFISKDTTRIELISDSVAPYKGAFELKAKVEYYNGQGYVPVDAGTVEFYIDDEILSSNTTLVDGVFLSSINSIENPAGSYTLWAKYSGTESYAAVETSQPFEIIGGKSKISVFDIQAKPYSIIQLKAKVIDVNNKNIISGYVDFNIKDIHGEDVNFNANITNIPVKNGLAISDDILLSVELESDFNTERYTIEAKYHNTLDSNNDDLYESSTAQGYIFVAKTDVILDYQSFYGTQYEPLGFYIRARDAETGAPVSSGKIAITLETEGVTIEEEVDDKGVARLIHNPLDFNAKDWNELEKFSFDVVDDDLHRYYDGTEFIADFDFFYNEQDGTLHYIKGKQNNENNEVSFVYNAETGKYDIIDTDTNDVIDDYDNEHLYITNGHLYARTTKDILRQYTIGTQNLKIEYISSGQYRSKTEYFDDGLQISQSNIDLDIHSYDLKYTDNDSIICYATKYTFTDDINTENINDGSVQFIVDNQVLDTVNIANGKAILKNSLLTNINGGQHLMCVKYAHNNDTSYSYSLLKLTKMEPSLNILVDQEIKNKKSNVIVTLSASDNLNVPLNGLISLYLDDELIGTQYLNGNEMLPGIIDEYNIEKLKEEMQLYSESERNIYIPGVIFSVLMPYDIDNHQLVAKYEGNEFLMPKTQTYQLSQIPVEIQINIKNNIYVARNEPCFIDVDVTYEDDIINEGKIVLTYGDEEIASSNVLDNKARLTWTPSSNNLLNTYVITYTGSTNYKDKHITANINVIDPLKTITIPNEQQHTLEDALMCLQSNGTIYITDDVILEKSIEITKDCSIIGENGVSIIKDIKELPIDFNILQNISTEQMQHMYKLDLSFEDINATDFTFIDNQLYLKGKTEMIPIYLAENGAFYSETPLSKILSDLNIIIKANVHFDNLTFKSNDSKILNNFVIYNESNCLITHSIIEKTAKLYNKGNMTAHRNLIYGLCQNVTDLDNNWWGSNTPPYNVNNHIIIDVKAVNTPAVISEEVEIEGEMIGANGQYYTIPQTDFSFTADSGYFSVDTGKVTNQKAHTTYLDAIKEGNVYFTVDNETVKCPVYDYERKTEVIIDDIDEVLINYQMPITAKVQSCADVYYEFDNDNNITESTKTINEGYIDFYIDNKQVGHEAVRKGKAQAKIFFKDAIYEKDTKYELKAIYHSSDNYFDSQSSISITTITDEDVCFVSTSGNDNGNGSYSNPFLTLSKAIASNNKKIFLLEGDYYAENIMVTHNVSIKKYNGEVNFSNNTGSILFNIQPNVKLNISKINFIENQTTTLFDNSGSLNIEQCIFYKNKGTLFKNNLTSTLFSVSLCAIVDNHLISSNINPNHYSYCWFGTNSPSDNFNDYIVMTTKTSKDKIYIGSLAHITAELKHYSHNGVQYNLDNPLPLRIAKFASDIGELKPVKDYTYHNSSTSLINTLKNNNTSQYIIRLKNRVYYDSEKINLLFNIANVFDEPVESGTLKVVITSENNKLENTIDIINGQATYNLPTLPIDEYNVSCTYIKKQIYNLNTTFVVKPLDIILQDIQLDEFSHLYYTHITGTAVDNLGQNINDEILDIKINDENVGTLIINDGVINQQISYNLLKPGQYEIILTNEDRRTKYDTLRYTIPLIVKPQKTSIVFDYNTIEKDISNNLIIEIYDSEGREVQSGTVRVDFNNTIYEENISVNNGIAMLNNFNIDNSGQYPIAIYYTDNDGYYKDSVYINNNFGVGIYGVTFSLSDTDIITADIGKQFTLNTTIKDIGNQLVNIGYVNVYIDDSLYVQNVGISNGNVSIISELPENISAGLHRLTLEYIGDNIYLDTYLDIYLKIGQIQTEIGIISTSGKSGQKSTINYTINSIYGNVNTGVLTAVFNEQIIGQSIVTDNITNQITFNTPFLPANNNYEITFKYHDNNNNYADSSITTKLIIERSNVIITPQKTWYYPQKDFNFILDVRDAEEKIIDNGKIDLYVNNVKEHEDISVVNGQAVIPMIFNKASTYTFDIVYKEDEYYLQTKKTIDFNVDSVVIDDINFKDELSSLPNRMFSTELIFTTLDDYIVKDGVVDILFDNNVIANYYMAENNKYVDFNIGNEIKGLHKITIKYYNSSLFKDFEKTYDFNIEAKSIDLRINTNNEYQSQNIEAISSDIINIQTDFILDNNYTPMSGIVNYYIGIPQYKINSNNEEYIDSYYDRLIGQEEFINETSKTHEYILTNDLLAYTADNLETHYRIKAHFIGNDEYEEAIETVDLNIYKQNTHIILPQDMQFEYQSKMNVNIDIINDNNENIIGVENVDIYLDDVLVSSCKTIDGKGTFTYQLKNKHVIGTYNLRAVFNGSAVNNPSESTVSFAVTPFTPILKTKDIDMYINGKNTLDNIIYDKNGVIIESGILKYDIHNDILESKPNVPEVIWFGSDFRDDWELPVEYISDDLTKYNNFTDVIHVHMHKNPIELSIYAPEQIYRGVPFDVTLKAKAPTTAYDVNLNFYKDDETYVMLNGSTTISLTYPTTLEDNSIIEDYIKTDGNDIFEANEILLKLKVKNQDNITVNTSIPESATNTHSIQKAIDLVSDYGSIEINTPISNQTIDLTKNLTIKGDATLTNCIINNESNKIRIDGLTFENGEDTCINNNANMTIMNCTFKNNQNSAINTNGELNVTQCTFIGNSAEKGACIKIGNKNYKTSITYCTFNENNASLYGGCIYSDKVNDMKIYYNEFSNNNNAGVGGSSICAYGDIAISFNTFFNNAGTSDIYLLRGTTVLENNLFDGAITSLKTLDGNNIDCDLNYWGYNDINNIYNNNPNIEINNFLISDCEIIEKETGNYIIGRINKYINRLESEITTINILEKHFPVKLNEEQFYLNDEIPIEMDDIFMIGQDVIHIEHGYDNEKIDSLFDNKSDVNHNHDDYENDINDLFNRIG